MATIKLFQTGNLIVAYVHANLGCFVLVGKWGLQKRDQNV